MKELKSDRHRGIYEKKMKQEILQKRMKKLNENEEKLESKIKLMFESWKKFNKIS